MAADAGVKVVAIADHDTLAGLPEAEAEALRLGVRVIPATELSVEWDGQDIHILAYFIDPKSAPLGAMLELLQEARRERTQAMLRRLELLGLPLRAERVEEQCPRRGPIGRPHLASALVAERWVASYHDAFRFYIGNGCPAYLPNSTPSPEESLRTLLEAGGVPVLAHPIAYRFEEVLDRFIPAGLMGLEVLHPRHDPEEIRRLRRMASDLGLLETGGSDYHGEGRGDVPPGSMPVGLDVLERLEQGRARIPEILRRTHGSAV